MPGGIKTKFLKTIRSGVLNQGTGIALFFLLPKSVKRKKDEFAEARQLTCATAA